MKKNWLALSIVGLLGLCSVSLQASQALLVSNYPEEITEPGTIGKVELNASSNRIMYYHKNGAKKPLFIAITLRNPTSKVVELTIKKALAGPDVDGLFVGHLSTRQWMETFFDSGETLLLFPGIQTQLVWHLIKPDTVSTGLIDITNPQQATLNLAIRVVESSEDNVSALNRPRQPFRLGWFTTNTQVIEKTITFNDSTVVEDIPIGAAPFLKDHRDGAEIKGNYALLYDIRLTLENTTAYSRTVQVLFSPLGGIARGIFMIDNRFIETAFLRQKKEEVELQKLETLILKPYEKRLIDVLTLPQAGSFYPAQLVIQSISK